MVIFNSYVSLPEGKFPKRFLQMSRVSWNVEKISPNFCTTGTFGVLPWLVDAVFKDFLVTTYAVVARFMHLEQNVHQQLLPVDGHEISMRERIGNMIMICSLLCVA